MFGGADYDPANIFYNDRLYFTCPTSAVSGERGGVGGPPIANPNVICQDTGVWAFGSLECAGEYLQVQPPCNVSRCVNVICSSSATIRKTIASSGTRFMMLITFRIKHSRD